MSIKEDELDLNVDRICRICLKTSEILKSIFDCLEGVLKYSDIIALFVPIAIHINDGLPQKICHSCVEGLNLLNNLRRVCVKSDTWLRDKLNSKFKQEIIFPSDDNDLIILDDLKQYKCEPFDEIFVNEDCVTVPTDELVNESRMSIEGSPNNEADDTDSDDEPLIQTKKNGKRSSYTCDICNKDFPNRHAVTRHSKVHNNAKGKQFKCEVCHVFLMTRKTLQRHRKIHLNPDRDKEYACKQCDGKSFNNQKSYAAHMRIHKTYYESEEESVHSGQDTEQSSDEKTNSNDRKPPKNTQLKRVFKCKDCFRVFEKRASLASHVRVHLEGFTKKEYICELCNERFSASLYLKRHWACHPEKRIHKCHLCDKTFVIRDQLSDHLNKHNDVRAHGCETCGKKFYSIETLRRHRYVHKPNYTADKVECLCPHCGKVFGNSTILRQHLNTHSDTKPFACEQCPSRFVSRRYLKKHMKTHDRIKPHVCDECGHAFGKRPSLIKHKRIHTGEKPYACTTCDRRFNSSDNLKRHILIHTGEKPYKCNMCDNAFTRRSELTGHMRKHLGGNIYQCDKCPERFRLQGELRDHILIHFLEEKEKEDAAKTNEIKPANVYAAIETKQERMCFEAGPE